jgi:hypothetical protein
LWPHAAAALPLSVHVRRSLFAVALAVSLARLVGFGYEFAGEALQADFSAYYTAGQMISAGLSPYRYLITPERIIWTGSDTYQHSQYIYLPLLAALFAPVTQAVSYLGAKYAWWLLDLLCLALVVTFSRRALRLPAYPWALVAVIFAAWFHPTLVQLLRGQIDLVTGVLVGAGLWLLARRGRDGLAGALLGVAGLIKFHALFIFPFLFMRRRWQAVFGFGAAGLVMLALNVALAGPENLRRYLAETPRMAQYGGDGPPESVLPPDQMALLGPLFPQSGGVYKDGFLFDHPGFEFVTNASFVELICCGAGFNLPRTAAAVAVLAFFGLCFAVLAWRGYFPFGQSHGLPNAQTDEYLYWLSVVNVALLAGPTTWTMNAVWLLPALPALIYLWRAQNDSLAGQIALVIFGLGLLLVAMPDHRSFPALFPRALLRLSIYKYPLGEFLMIVGTWVHLRRRRLAAAGG